MRLDLRRRQPFQLKRRGGEAGPACECPQQVARARRDSAGSFRWRLSADGTSFASTFASSAAARGVSAAVRLP